VRELIAGLLLQPEAARSLAIPRPDDGTSEGMALAALAQFCTTASAQLSTAGTMQHFAGTMHEPVLVAALASASDQGMTLDMAQDHLREGVRRYWLLAQQMGRPGVDGASTSPLPADLPAEEGERFRQLEMARRSLAATSPAGPSSDTG
jgi:hypothetical protein